MIGSVDVKSTPVYFYVQKTTPFYGFYPTHVPFEVTRLNIGGAMNLATGTFTAPRPGRYFFCFSGVSITSSTYGWFDVSLYLNGEHIGRGETQTKNGNMDTYDWETYTLQSVLNLKRGDQVWLSVSSQGNTFLQDNNNRFTHFTGWLLEEDVFSS